MRKKSDGTAFEKEFKEAMQKKYYIRRLPTLSQSQPSDYIVIGKHFNYTEVKETTGDRFSISQMQQYDEFIQFMNEKKRLADASMLAINEMDYILVVHFLKYNVFKAVNSHQMLKLVEKKTTLKYNDTEGKTFNDLETLVEEIDI